MDQCAALSIQTEVEGLNSPSEYRFSAPSAPPSGLGHIHCPCEANTAKEGVGHLPSYAEAKKIQSLTRAMDVNDYR